MWLFNKNIPKSDTFNKNNYILQELNNAICECHNLIKELDNYENIIPQEILCKITDKVESIEDSVYLANKYYSGE